MALAQIGLALLMLGFVLIVCGVILAVIQSFKAARRRVGGAILIGPFPIIFGDRDLVKYSFALLVVMAILALILLLLPSMLA